jgi:hypothetical protein
MMQLERYLKVLHLLASPHTTLDSRCCTSSHTLTRSYISYIHPLKVLTATPELALSPPVCTFLDAVDVAQFRTQMLPTAPPARQAFVPVTPSAPR